MCYEQSTYSVRRSGKDEEEKEVLSFFSLSSDAASITTATDVALADAAEAPGKDGSEEEAADGTAGGNGLFHERWMEEVG